jgi:hypothetical protein
VPFLCPVCGGGTLKSVSAGKVIYLADGNQPRPLDKLQVCSCESNAHIVIIAADKDRMPQISEMNSASDAPETRILNSWKEIAAHMGRGVRTVQRWEQELGLPVRRPRGKSRSAVIARATDLDQWLNCVPVGNGSNSQGRKLHFDSIHGVPDEALADVSKIRSCPPPGSATNKRPERRSIVKGLSAAQALVLARQQILLASQAES